MERKTVGEEATSDDRGRIRGQGGGTALGFSGTNEKRREIRTHGRRRVLGGATKKSEKPLGSGDHSDATEKPGG